MGRIDGFIDVGEILKNIGVLEFDIDSDKFIDNDSIISLTHDAFDNVLLEFRYNNEVYFYKYSWMCTPYSELIANELAHDFGILSVEYDLAILDDRKGVLSKSFKKNNCEYITGEKVLLNFWGDRLDIEHHNNLEDIWDALEYRYRKYSNKKEIVECLMKKIVQIFIFDIITCQNDRHPLNWQIMESNDLVDMVPFYDNQRIVAITGVGSYVSLTIDSHIFGYLFDELKSFLKVSEDCFSDLIKEKIIIIGNENLESIFKRIEEKTGYPMPQDEKEYYLEKFRNHRELLEKELTKCDKIKRKR